MSIPSGSDIAAFQSAMDCLPSGGGFIMIDDGDYSNLNPYEIILPAGKMVNWFINAAILPDEWPGAVYRAGYRLQPHESSNAYSPRPGNAYQRIIVESHIPNTAQTNQQDSILYIEGHIPDVEIPLAQEFSAIRLNMTTKAKTAGVPYSNADVKGINGIFVGDGGNGKVRAIRTTSAGINGHSGLVTGIMAAAHRSGVIPQTPEFGGDGIRQFVSGQAGPYGLGMDAPIIAQVGPGIPCAIRMEGFAGVERPQYGIYQNIGNQGLEPSVAVIGIHGGGSGAMIQGRASAVNQRVVFSVDSIGKVMGQGFNSGTYTVADDCKITIDAPTSGFIGVFAVSTSAAWIFGYFRTGATPFLTPIAAGSVARTSTAALSGTTGDDNCLTISTKVDGNIDIENRTSVTRSIVVVFLGA